MYIKFFIIYIILVISSIIIHELGHFICGHLAKLKCNGFTIGIWYIDLENKKITKLSKLQISVLMSGENINKKQYILFIIGGCLFNFISAIFIFHNNIILNTFGMINLALGIANILPIPIDYYSDGMKLYRICNKKTSKLELIDYNLMTNLHYNNLIDIIQLEKLNNTNCYYSYKYFWYKSLLFNNTKEQIIDLKNKQSTIHVMHNIQKIFEIEL